MSSSQATIGFSKIKQALLALEALDIQFQGPFVTPGGQHIYVVDACLLVEAEIVELHSSGKFKAENIAEVPNEIRRHQTANIGVNL
jgi:hypothetical protein